LLRCPRHLVIANKLVPFESKQSSQAALIKISSPACIHLVTTQHSGLYKKIGKIPVLYNFSLVQIEIRDFEKRLSRLCITAQQLIIDSSINDRDAQTVISGLTCNHRRETVLNAIPFQLLVTF